MTVVAVVETVGFDLVVISPTDFCEGGWAWLVDGSVGVLVAESELAMTTSIFDRSRSGRFCK
jgi:hypothetical protein